MCFRLEAHSDGAWYCTIPLAAASVQTKRTHEEYFHVHHTCVTIQFCSCGNEYVLICAKCGVYSPQLSTVVHAEPYTSAQSPYIIHVSGYLWTLVYALQLCRCPQGCAVPYKVLDLYRQTFLRACSQKNFCVQQFLLDECPISLIRPIVTVYNIV